MEWRTQPRWNPRRILAAKYLQTRRCGRSSRVPPAASAALSRRTNPTLLSVAARCLSWWPRAAHHRQPGATVSRRAIVPVAVMPSTRSSTAAHRLNVIFGPRHALPLVFPTSWCPRSSRGTDMAKPHKRHFAVPFGGLSTNSPWSRTFPVHGQVAAEHSPRHFRSLTRSFSSLSTKDSRAVLQISGAVATLSRAIVVLPLVE